MRRPRAVVTGFWAQHTCSHTNTHADTGTHTPALCQDKGKVTCPGRRQVLSGTATSQSSTPSSVPASRSCSITCSLTPIHTLTLTLVLPPPVSLSSFQGAAMDTVGFKAAAALLPSTAPQVSRSASNKGTKKHRRGEPHREWTVSEETFTPSEKKQLYFTYFF